MAWRFGNICGFGERWHGDFEISVDLDKDGMSLAEWIDQK